MDKKIKVVIGVILVVVVSIFGMIDYLKDFDGFANVKEKETIKANPYKVYTLKKEVTNEEIDYYLLEFAYISEDKVNYRISTHYKEEGLQNGTVFTTNNIEKDDDKLIFLLDGYEFIYSDEELEIKVNDNEELSGIYELVKEEQNNFKIPSLPSYEKDKYTDNFEIDSTLAKSIREELNLEENVPLTKENLESIKELLIWDNNIVTLKGIKYLTNLERLIINNSTLTDIRELTKLKNIKEIGIHSGYIKEIPDFSNNLNLERLDITRNLITDIESVTKIKNLKYLNLDSNPIKSIKPIKDLKNLEYLVLDNTGIIDYEELKDNESLQNVLNLDYKIFMEVEDKAKSIISEIIENDMNDLEKEIAILNYMIENVDYGDSLRPQRPDGYYPLIKNFGVCGDYADAFTILGRLAGLDVQTVVSSTHAWNIIKIGDEYYNIDVLWIESDDNLAYLNRSTEYILTLEHHTYDLNRYPISNNDMNEVLYAHLINS